MSHDGLYEKEFDKISEKQNKEDNVTTIDKIELSTDLLNARNLCYREIRWLSQLPKNDAERKAYEECAEMFDNLHKKYCTENEKG